MMFDVQVYSQEQLANKTWQHGVSVELLMLPSKLHPQHDA